MREGDRGTVDARLSEPLELSNAARLALAAVGDRNRAARGEVPEAVIRSAAGLCLIATEHRVVLARCEAAAGVDILAEWPYGMLERIEVVAGSQGGRLIVQPCADVKPSILPLDPTCVLDALAEVAVLAWRIRAARGA